MINRRDTRFKRVTANIFYCLKKPFELHLKMTSINNENQSGAAVDFLYLTPK